MNKQVTITDVTLREFGQNVPSGYLHIFNPRIRAEIVKDIVDAGFRRIEVFSFVNPTLAPAMEPALLNELIRYIKDVSGVEFITLVPNWKGYERFLSMGLGPDGLDHTIGVFFLWLRSTI